MKDYVMRILRWQGLVNRIKSLRRILAKKEAQLDEIQETCKHEVIVFTEEEHCLAGYDDNLYQKCLFCGAESTSRQSFPNSLVIDVSLFKKENHFDRDTKFNIVKSLYIETANANPESSAKEIVLLVSEELDSQDKQFRKAMDGIKQ